MIMQERRVRERWDHKYPKKKYAAKKLFL